MPSWLDVCVEPGSGIGVREGVRVSVGVGVRLGVTVEVGVGVDVGEGVMVGVGVAEIKIRAMAIGVAKPIKHIKPIAITIRPMAPPPTNGSHRLRGCRLGGAMIVESDGLADSDSAMIVGTSVCPVVGQKRALAACMFPQCGQTISSELSANCSDGIDSITPPVLGQNFAKGGCASPQ